MTLEQYLHENGLRNDWFAKRLGITREHLSRVKAGTVRPSRSLALFIERETNGKVPASIWETAR